MKTKIILGTVQFGLNYGINNSIGKPSEDKVFEILDAAIEQNIQYLDTAPAYGNAIDLIGLYHQQSRNVFKVLSKFKNIKEGEIYDLTRYSLDKLGIANFEVYSYHSFDNYLNYPHITDELLLLKEKGLIKKIGISIYTNNELEKVLLDKKIDVIQLPFNLLDNQNDRGKYLKQAKPNNKEIHTRSAFLQGLLLMNEASIPENLMALKPYIKEIKSFCDREKISMQSLALSYAIYNEQIDQVLLGVDTKDQLMHNLDSIKNTKHAFEYINQNIYVNEKELLNPVNWQ